MNFFDIVAPFYERLHFGAKKSFTALKSLGDFQKTDKVLDLGGGVGRIAKFFVNHVQEMVVVDSSPQMLKRCQNHSGIICKLAEAHDLPFSNNYFDKVIIVDAFHHFQDQEKVCQEVRRVLKSNGVVLIEEFNPQNFFGWLIVVMEKLLRMKSKFYSPASLVKFFQTYQFKIKLENEKRSIYYLMGEKI